MSRGAGRAWPIRGFGLRARLTLLATGLSALVSAALLWLGWLLAGNVVDAVPQLPPNETVEVDGKPVLAKDVSDALRDNARDEVLTTGSIVFVLVVGAAGLVSWVLAGQVLRPLQDVTATARRLSVESLDARLRHSGYGRLSRRSPRDEVADLADTFDDMLDRLQAAFEAQRRFVANASHELRTPLAVIRTEIDVTTLDPAADAAELRRMADVVRDATLRAQQLVDGLLLLARAEGAVLREVLPVDLGALVTDALQIAESDVRARGLSVRRWAGTAATEGDPALLERVVGNLIENAVRHNVEGGWLEVETSSTVGQSLLRVSSSGEQVDPALVAELFEPFRRAGVARTARDGAGLGLSIVWAIIEAHGGSVRAEPVPGGGLTVTVELPAVSPAVPAGGPSVRG